MSYCVHASDRVVGSGVSRAWSWHPGNSQQLDPISLPGPNPVPAQPVPPPNKPKEPWWCALYWLGGPAGIALRSRFTDKCGESCSKNLGDAIKTSNWSDFKGFSGLENVMGCFFWVALLLIGLAALAFIFGVGSPVITPIVEGIVSLFRLIGYWGWESLVAIWELVSSAILAVADALGANHWIVGVTLSTGLAWAMAEILIKSIGYINDWSQSDFATIFRFLDTPFELAVLAAGSLSPLLGWLVRLLLLPLEAGALLVSFVLGIPWEILKYIWKGIFNKGHNGTT